MKTNNQETAIALQGETSMGDLMTFAKTIAASGLIPDAYRGKPADILVTLVTGRELGISPMQSLRGIHIIKGKAVMSADLIVALCKRSPSCKYFTLVSSTPVLATYKTHRHGDPEPTTMDFSMEDARTARLTGNPTWSKYPNAMLRARCMTALARVVYPDICFGLFETDEGHDIAGRAEALAPAAEPAKKKSVRKTPTPTEKAPTPTEPIEVIDAIDGRPAGWLLEVVEEAPALPVKTQANLFAEITAKIEGLGQGDDLQPLMELGAKIKRHCAEGKITSAQRDDLVSTFIRSKKSISSRVESIENMVQV
jgi:hypothetical protein